MKAGKVDKSGDVPMIAGGKKCRSSGKAGSDPVG